MDPEACLQRFEKAVEETDLSEAVQAMHDYANWRIRGGFEPFNGDKTFSRLSHALAEDLDHMGY